MAKPHSIHEYDSVSIGCLTLSFDRYYGPNKEIKHDWTVLERRMLSILLVRKGENLRRVVKDV